MILVLKKFMSHIGQKCDKLKQFFSTCEENKTLTKKDRVKMSPFYVEGDRKIMQVKPRPSHLWRFGQGLLRRRARVRAG